MHSGGMTASLCSWAAFAALKTSYEYAHACTGVRRENWDKIPGGFGGAAGYNSYWGANAARSYAQVSI